MLAEEQQKLREKEEKLRLEEQERLERERLITEKENDLKRKAVRIFIYEVIKFFFIKFLSLLLRQNYLLGIIILRRVL